MRPFLLLLSLLQLTYLAAFSQDAFNAYQVGTISSADITLSTNSQISFTWFNRSLVGGYSGEYEITLARHPWSKWMPSATSNPVHISYSMEVVGFPFTNECASFTNGCAGSQGRPFFMPLTYSPNQMGNVTTYFHNLDWDNSDDQTLVSYAFQSNLPLTQNQNNIILPHTAIKHTIYLHCGAYTNQPPYPPILYSQSWVYDNTRGRMRFYPFCINQPGNCTMSDWDLIFAPEIIRQDAHSYNETNDKLFFPISGTINYFPFQEVSNLALCANSSILNLNLPSSMDNFGSAWPNMIFDFPYAPPYSLLSAPLLQFRGNAIAGFETDPVLNNQILELPGGIQHSYFIDQNLPIGYLSGSDLTIYNPSDVTVTADNLIFPSHFTFKTIRGVYPSQSEALNDNTVENGGPYSDIRDVPVRTDLRSEDPLFPNSLTIPEDSRYASLYKLQNGAKITIKPCVKIFDAAFILNSGSTLKYENYNTQIGYYPDNLAISRVAIDRNGGRLIRQYDNTLPNATLFLQNQTEVSTAPNSYIVDEKIMAGSNVDPGQTAGPYIASSGTDLELIAKNYVKLENGFQAHAGSEVKIAVDPFMNIPVCPQPSSSNNLRFANNQVDNLTKSKSLIIPNPIFTQAKVTLLQNETGNYIQQLQLHDTKGQLILIKENLSSTSEIIDATALNNGLYLLTVITNNHTEVLKFVVNKVH